MQKRQERTLDAFRQVLAYLERNPIKPEPPLLAGKRKQLETSIARAFKLSGRQLFLKGEASGHVDQRRRDLRRDSMMPLVRIAKPLLKYAPGIESALRVPHARADAKTVAAAALRMADAIAPHTRLLRSAGYPKSFLTEFRSEARALMLSAKTAEKGRANRSAVTAAIAAEVKKGMEAVTVIEGLVMLHLARDKVELAHWKDRRRVKSRIGRPRARKPNQLPA